MSENKESFIGTEIMKFENCVNVNSLSIHPTLPIAVTAHDDRNIRFWDLQRFYFKVFD